MPMEGDEEDDEEEGYWRSQQQGSEDGSDDEEYTPQARSPKEVISCLSTLSQTCRMRLFFHCETVNLYTRVYIARLQNGILATLLTPPSVYSCKRHPAASCAETTSYQGI